MPKKIPLNLCLLFGLLFAFPAQAATPAIAKLGIADTMLQLAVEPTPAASTITLKDLPPGFRELPPEISAALSSRLDLLSQQIGQENLKPENFFAFVNPQDFQIVFGFTNKIPSQPQQASFDASMQQLSKPEVQKRMLTQLQERVKLLGEIKVTDYRSLPGLTDIANVSTGITIGLETRGQPLRIDIAAFRRDATGGFTGVMYPLDKQPTVGVGDVARKLDGRIGQLPAASPNPTTNSPK
jgi:hypothetical protein